MFRRLMTVVAFGSVFAAGMALPDAGRASVPAPVLTRITTDAGHHPSRSGFASPKLGIRHVFMIIIENESFASTYRKNPNHYLGRKLQRQGTLLTNYYATGHVSLDNYVSMLSGQAPNVDTQADCRIYIDFQPRPAPLDKDGQAVGRGCVYPRNVKTVADQLRKKHISWGGYMDDMGNDLTREPSRCGEPAASFGSGMPDGTQSADAGDQYAARHNPFVYFHSLIDTGACHRHVVPLTHLRYDLRSPYRTPHFTFITPNLCNDGHDKPCKGKDAAGKKTGGLASVDHFLKLWVPRIKRSPAYQKNGLLIIAADESDNGDTASCCGEQAGPGSPRPGIRGMGGGRIGALVMGRCIKPGTRDKRKYNHYSLLRSLEDIYGVRHGGSDHKGHLGFAGAKGLRPFGPDLFRACPRRGRA
ncbi:MAG: hypothetical protein JO214_11185 [Frankiaceae bacterium]|nr:hypothetical protein [Frankiaceae bacterium]